MQRMTRLHYICVVLLIVSALLFLGVGHHHATLESDELGLASALTSVTSKVMPELAEPTSGSPRFESAGLSITERRAVSIFVLVCFAILMLVVLLVIKERELKGKKDFQIPLIAIAIMLAITFLNRGIDSGMLFF